MAVYTKVSLEEVDDLLQGYDIGDVVELKGISEGVSNTNYYLETSEGKFIFTVFEGDEDESQLLYSLNLLNYISGKGIDCPSPIIGNDGAIIHNLHGKLIAITSFLEGKSVKSVQNDNCKMLGGKMAEMHLAAEGFDMENDNDNTFRIAWEKLYDKLGDKIDDVKPGLRSEMLSHYDEINAKWPADLPSGVIHGDLFPDNVFFLDKKVSGIIDFYFACNDFYIYDLAICINSWCFEHGAQFNITKAKSLLSSYNEARTLTKDELEAIPVLCAGAAMRFLLTRLDGLFSYNEHDLVTPKDPIEILQILRFHMQVKSHTEYGL